MGHGVGLVLAYDEGRTSGLGHRRRMQALADALALTGTTGTMSPVAGPLSADVLVVDSYLRRADDTAHFRARSVVAIDDLGRDLAVDLLVDPNPGSAPCANARKVLAGPKYALVDPSLWTRWREPDEVVRSVLVTAGAADAAGLAVAIASELASLLPETKVSVTVGPWSAATVPDGVATIATSGGLTTELVASDLVITAGGVTMLEAMIVGSPVVAVVTADNQRRAVDGAVAAGAVAAADAATAASVAARLATAHDERLALTTSARRYVDGRGAERVASEVLALL